MFGGILYIFELLEIAQAEKGSWCELCSYSLFHFLWILEPLLLSVLEAVDEFCWRDACCDYKYILADFTDLLY